MGYASFGYFLYSLHYHFFRNEFDPFILILVAVIILIPVIFIVDSIVSTLRLLSTQTVDVWVVIKNAAYPTLDTVMIFLTVIMFWGARRMTRRHKNAVADERKLEQETSEKNKSPSDYLVSSSASIYLLLLFMAMMLSAAGDTGFAYTSAFDITTVQDYVWMWNMLYNSDHLCLAAALVGYRHFFSFNKIGILYYFFCPYISFMKFSNCLRIFEL